MTPTILAGRHRGRRRVYGSASSILTAITLFGAIACAGDSGTGPSNNDPAGSYRLSQVDTKPIPVEVFNGPYYDPDLGYSYQLVLRVTGGVVDLEPDGEFHMIIQSTWSSGGDDGTDYRMVDGTYRVNGSKIFIDTDSGSGSGAFQDGQITFSLDVGETGTMKKYTFRRSP
jgi:hypothetical protein